MSVIMRNGRALVRRVDQSQAGIVQSLRDAMIEVWEIGEPCDLLTRFWCERHHDFCWQPLEVKSAYGKKNPKARTDKRQKQQQEFLETTRTPVVINFEQAWEALNRLHRIKGVTIRPTLPHIKATC